MSSSTDVAMSQQQPTANAAKQKKAKKTVAGKAKTVGGKQAMSNHPKYNEMIHQALTTLKERGGSSRQAILKYIVKNFQVGTDENVVNSHLKLALKAGVKNGGLKQSKGTGASGSFRLGATEGSKTKASKTKKDATMAKSPKKARSEKAGVVKKPKKAAAGNQKKLSGGRKKKVEKVKKAASPVKKVKGPAPKKSTAAGKPKAAPKKTVAKNVA